MRKRRIMVITGSVFILLWTLVPIGWSVLSSITSERELTSLSAHLVPKKITFDNYKNLIFETKYKAVITQAAGPKFKRAAINSLIVAFLTMCTVLFLSSFSGYVFSRLKFKGQKVIFFSILATMPIPVIAVLIPLYRLISAWGFIDTYLSLVLIYAGAFLPISIWIMTSHFNLIPLAIEDAALIDGCSRIGSLLRILLPIVSPGLFVVSILTFLNSWIQFLMPLIFAPDKSKQLPVVISEFVTKYSTQYGLMNAGGVIAIIPPLILVIFFQRYLIGGLMGGAVKE